MAENIGRVISISGPAVDVQFEEKTMPPIYQALRIVSDGFDVPTPLSVIVEVQQEPVSTPADVQSRVDSVRKQNRKSVLMLIQRQDNLQWVPVPLADDKKESPG